MDNNFRSYSDETDVKIVAEEIRPPDDFVGSDTLHLSNVARANISYCNIYGLNEDCIDMNRGTRDVIVSKCDLFPRGKYGFTIKGGTHNVEISDCVFYYHGKTEDIDIGNWSDQSDELTTGIVLKNLTSADGRPVRVRVLWGDVPIVIGGNVKVIPYPRFVVKIYRWLRKRSLVP